MNPDDLPTATSRHAGEWQETAERLRAADRLLLVSDFDGTLAPIREDPDAPAILPAAKSALAALVDAPGTDVAVVSGRALADVRERVGLDGVVYAGNHGLEIDAGTEDPESDAGDREFVHPEAEAAAGRVRGVSDELGDRLATVAGAFVEEKGVTATVHYRQVDDDATESRVRETVREVAGDREGLRVTEGKQIREVRPDVDWNKGRAVTWLREELDAGPEVCRAVYLGDDVTDEAAFRALADGESGIRVGDAGETAADETAADYRLPNPAAVADLLSWLADGRAD